MYHVKCLELSAIVLETMPAVFVGFVDFFVLIAKDVMNAFVKEVLQICTNISFKPYACYSKRSVRCRWLGIGKVAPTKHSNRSTGSELAHLFLRERPQCLTQPAKLLLQKL